VSNAAIRDSMSIVAAMLPGVGRSVLLTVNPYVARTTC
jgi:hypothetical protein